MSIDDRERWTERHRHASGLSPRLSVLELPVTTAGHVALDVACGQGRHTAALADAGYAVVAMDIAMPALRHLQDRLRASVRSRVLAVAGDADAWPLAPCSFDLIVQVDFLDRRRFGDLRRALKPGGLLLVDTFLDQGRPNAEGPSRREFLLAPGELPRAFGDFDVVRYVETHGDTARATWLGRKRRS